MGDTIEFAVENYSFYYSIGKYAIIQMIVLL